MLGIQRPFLASSLVPCSAAHGNNFGCGVGRVLNKGKVDLAAMQSRCSVMRITRRAVVNGGYGYSSDKEISAVPSRGTL